tara:strand:- start:4073 stop:4291 length:219 start_codon:yes stop_codon:yes gene_type:complete
MKLTKSQLKEMIKEEIKDLNEWVSLQDDNYGKVVYFFDYVAKKTESNELKKLAKQGQKIMGKMSKFAGGAKV